MRRMLMVLLLAGVSLMTVSCGARKEDATASEALSAGPFAGLQGKIDIAGGTAHIPVMAKAAEAVMKANPNIRITVAGGGSGVGAKQVAAGLVHIGNTGRPLSDQERQAGGLISFAFAVDGVAVVVHPDNTAKALTTQQVCDIFAGRITSWKQLGGIDRGINIYSRDEASGTRAVFWKKLLAKGEIIQKANVVASNGAMKVAVAGDPYAIGYVSIGHIDDTVRPLAIDDVVPSQENASSGKYPVVRKLFMNTKGEPEGLTKTFVDYIMSAEGKRFVEDSGYIPIGK